MQEYREEAKEIGQFLETISSDTDNKSGSLYVTLSLSFLACNALIRKFKSFIERSNDTLFQISSAMLSK